MTENPIKMLLVEDEDDFRESCARWMRRKGHDVSTAASGAEALGLCEEESFEVAVFDMNMPGMSGMELLQRVHQDKIEMEVIILTGQGTIETAVSAMKLGACDFLSKPCSLGDLEHHCELARDRGKLRRENKQLKEIISRSKPALEMVGESPVMKHVIKVVQKVAPTDKPVLIQGESGTGKEVVARAIQQNSAMADKPFVTINCAALPEQLVESELFGHQKGAFTGATSDKPGLFEIADGGTLFIDEVGELPLSLQPKLLRVLEDGSMRRIGSHKERTVKVRLIAATNRDLSDEVAAGNFREDLFYRINVLSLQLPPLREREGDIDRLIDHYLPVPWHIDDAARDAMNRYSWPGNIRQLINVIQRATILADGNDVTLDDLPSEIANCTDVPSDRSNDQDVSANGSAHQAAPLPPSLKLDDVAKTHVLYVLDKENGNKAKAARVLGIHRRKLYRLLERFAGNECKEESVSAVE
ncbi:sigma-54-dependent transcriptional regulator [Stieleria varia]|uniref:Transcriptional regulatory protein ZraR n=1 Tax=Stieleria varia TaxID=2528005 RepID=A0A5C6A4C0_9BACT|nr:sigma-54 dependent transcriptional regulator [Stieleria varia]TWT93951.1 Transcriptional regulatory protein ZraR [Stieleria varia]